MNLRQIEAFRAAIEEGSFSGAAARLQVSQPTVSKVIDQLERTLGYQLFRRDGRRVLPTVKAMALYREVVNAWRGLDRLSTVAQTLREPTGGRIIIGANPTIASGFIQKIIARFLATRPNVEVALECDSGRQLVQGVLAGTIDIGFATRDLNEHSQTAPGTIPAERLLVGDLVCVMPANHRLAAKSAIELADLTGESFVGLTTTREARRTVDEMFDKAGIVPRMSTEASTATAVCLLVAEGLGISLVADLTAQAAMDAYGGVLAARPFKPRLCYSIDYAISRHASASVLVDGFRRVAQENAADVHRSLMKLPAIDRPTTAPAPKKQKIPRL